MVLLVPVRHPSPGIVSELFRRSEEAFGLWIVDIVVALPNPARLFLLGLFLEFFVALKRPHSLGVRRALILSWYG